jgi:hypothetical protein
MHTGLLVLFFSSVGLAAPFNSGGADSLLRREERLGKHWEERQLWVTAEEKAEIARLDPKRPTLLILEGLSSGAGYAPAARELFPGIQLIHIQAGVILNPGLGHSFQRAHYDANIVYTGKNRESFAKLLEPFKAGSLKVVAAAESGVALYDEVLDLLGTPNTEQVPGKVLRNKFRMAETAKKFLHEVGVETIPGIASSDAGSRQEVHGP